MIVILAGAVFVAYASITATTVPAGIFLATLVACFIVGLYFYTKWIWFGFIVFAFANLLVHPWFPYGLFGNPNYIGAALAVAFAACLSYRQPLPAIALGGGILLTQSRTAIFGASAAIFAWCWNRSKPVALSLALLGILIVATITSGRDTANTAARLGVWQDTINHMTLLGSGWGSFYEAYWAWPIHTNMTLMRPAHAYNDFLELTFELGIFVIPLWILIGVSLENSTEESNIVIWTFLILGLTFYPLYILPLGHLFAYALGHAAKGAIYGKMETYTTTLPKRTGYELGAQGD